MTEVSDQIKSTDQNAAAASSALQFEPPLASINKIVKAVLPKDVTVTKDARQAFQRAATAFIFYLTHCSNDISNEHKRSTIKSDDVLKALKELDFAEYEGPVEEFVAQMKAISKSNLNSNSKRKLEEGKGTNSDAVNDNTNLVETDADMEQDGEVSDEDVSENEMEDVDGNNDNSPSKIQKLSAE